MKISINIEFEDGYTISETKDYSFEWDFSALIEIHGTIVSLLIDC